MLHSFAFTAREAFIELFQHFQSLLSLGYLSCPSGRLTQGTVLRVTCKTRKTQGTVFCVPRKTLGTVLCVVTIRRTHQRRTHQSYLPSGKNVTA